MDSSAIPVFLAGPFPVIHSARLDSEESNVELDVALLIGGLPTMLAATSFPLDDTWDRVEHALQSGDARLGVAGMPHQSDDPLESGSFPSAYIGLECANGERLVLAHIRGSDPSVRPEVYARRVIRSILQGHTPAELGEAVYDE